MSGRKTGWTAAGVWAVLVLAAAGLALAPPAARAQRRAIVAYVLDFNNSTRVGGPLLGRIAAAQAALELAESPNWEIVPEAQVQRRIAELGLKPPYDRIDRQRIAAGVDAEAVVYGSIVEAQATPGRDPAAFVRLRVLVEDVRTGVLINGAEMEGRVAGRGDLSGDADRLLEEAIGKAAFRAREFMDLYRLPEGTVLNTTVVGSPTDPDLDALINIGARQGVRRGMEFLVTRQGEPVGRLRVTSVDADLSTARVVENVQGVRPEDRARAIFSLSRLPRRR